MVTGILLLLLLIVMGFSGNYGVSNMDSLHLSDFNGTATPNFLVNQRGSGVIAVFQDAGTPIATWNNGGGFVSGGAMDLNGQQLILDVDGDTSLTADTDDQIDVEIGSADEFIFTAGIFDIGNGTLGRIDLDADNDTSIRSSVDDQIDLEIGATDEITLTAARLSLNDTFIFQALGTENLGTGKTILTQVIPFGAAAGGSGTLATITDGEIWFIHSVFIRTTTNFDATGDDVTFVIGDGNDANGFLDAVDAELQATFTEATGYAAGWFGIESGSGSVYTLDDGGPFVYAPSGSDETIDWLLDETSGETITAGSLTTYVVYTRIQ